MHFYFCGGRSFVNENATFKCDSQLSDGNAAGCSSEVLTWQMGLKGEVSQCQRQDFNSKLSDLFSSIIHGKWELSAESWLNIHTVLLCSLFKTKASLVSLGLKCHAQTHKHFWRKGKMFLLYIFFQTFWGFKLVKQSLFLASTYLMHFG